MNPASAYETADPVEAQQELSLLQTRQSQQLEQSGLIDRAREVYAKELREASGNLVYSVPEDKRSSIPLYDETITDELTRTRQPENYTVSYQKATETMSHYAITYDGWRNTLIGSTIVDPSDSSPHIVPAKGFTSSNVALVKDMSQELEKLRDQKDIPVAAPDLDKIYNQSLPEQTRQRFSFMARVIRRVIAAAQESAKPFTGGELAEGKRIQAHMDNFWVARGIGHLGTIRSVAEPTNESAESATNADESLPVAKEPEDKTPPKHRIHKALTEARLNAATKLWEKIKGMGLNTEIGLAEAAKDEEVVGLAIAAARAGDTSAIRVLRAAGIAEGTIDSLRFWRVHAANRAATEADQFRQTVFRHDRQPSAPLRDNIRRLAEDESSSTQTHRVNHNKSGRRVKRDDGKRRQSSPSRKVIADTNKMLWRL